MNRHNAISSVLCILSICCCLTMTGCKWLHNYNKILEQYPEIEELEEEGVDVSRLTEEDRLLRNAQMRVIADAPYPPYLIDTGDRLNLSVYNHEDLNASLMITPDGFIAVPFVGQIKVKELTIPQAVKAIEDGFEPYLKNFAVGLSPIETPSQQATIGGTISSSGTYPVRDGVRISDIFAMAGSGRVQMFNGQALDMSDYQNSILIRKGKILPVDFEAAILRGDTLHNLTVHKGDYIYIASRTDAMISVIGAVTAPRYLTWNPKMRMTDAIANVGGLQPTYWKYAIIIRGGGANPTFYRVNLDEVLAGLKKNPLLHTGDIVYVPMDGLSYYNIFISKLLPTSHLFNMTTTPITFRNNLQDND